MFLSGEKVEGERCMSSGSSVKGSSQQSSTSGPKVKEGAHYFQAQAHLLWGGGGGGLVNDTTPVSGWLCFLCLLLDKATVWLCEINIYSHCTKISDSQNFVVIIGGSKGRGDVHIPHFGRMPPSEKSWIHHW